MSIRPNKIQLLTFQIKILKSEIFHKIKSFVKRTKKFIQQKKNIKMYKIENFIQ